MKAFAIAADVLREALAAAGCLPSPSRSRSRFWRCLQPAHGRGRRGARRHAALRQRPPREHSRGGGGDAGRLRGRRVRHLLLRSAVRPDGLRRLCAAAARPRPGWSTCWPFRSGAGRCLAGTLLGVLALSTGAALYGAGGFAIILGFKTGVWTFGPLLAAVLAGISFSAVYAAMLTTAVFVRSAALSDFVGFLLFALGVVASYREQLVKFFRPGLATSLMRGGLAMMPPIAALGGAAAHIAGSSEIALPRLLALIAGVLVFGAAISSRWAPFASTERTTSVRRKLLGLLAIAALLGLAAWLFGLGEEPAPPIVQVAFPGAAPTRGAEARGGPALAPAAQAAAAAAGCENHRPRPVARRAPPRQLGHRARGQRAALLSRRRAAAQVLRRRRRAALRPHAGGERDSSPRTSIGLPSSPTGWWSPASSAARNGRACSMTRARATAIRVSSTHCRAQTAAPP